MQLIINKVDKDKGIYVSLDAEYTGLPVQTP
jgi:hypothetical protein